jgi:hypothetical protein
VRTDPTDNGGLFIGRRPGTAPVRYRGVPEPSGPGRRRADRVLAALILATMVVGCLLFWGPFPALALWVASQVQHASGSVGAGLAAGFALLLVLLFGGLMVLKRLDQAWVLVRRAAGHDQRRGVIGPVFGATAIVGAIAFSVWLLLIEGPGSTVLSG